MALDGDIKIEVTRYHEDVEPPEDAASLMVAQGNITRGESAVTRVMLKVKTRSQACDDKMGV